MEKSSKFKGAKTVAYISTPKMPKFDTLDALNDETTSMLKTLTHSLSFSGSKRYIYIGGNKSFGAHTAESLCFQWEQIYCIKHKRSQTTAAT